jgi:hypothetical protein
VEDGLAAAEILEYREQSGVDVGEDGVCHGAIVGSVRTTVARKL